MDGYRRRRKRRGWCEAGGCILPSANPPWGLRLRHNRSRYTGYRVLGGTRSRRQLQHRSVLTSARFCKQHYFTIRKFHGIVMDSRFVHVDLPKPGYFGAGFSSKKWQQAVVLDFSLKSDLGAWKETTATFGSPIAAKPRVMVLLKMTVLSLSPTLAGRVMTLCRL
jgi:hypothetical protein